MNPNFENQQSDYTRKPEYAELSMHEQLEESAIVTKALDALLEKISSPKPTYTGGINRIGSVSYFDGDLHNGNDDLKPVQKIITVRNMDEPSQDTYIVNIETHIDNSQTQIGTTTYTLEFTDAGKNFVIAKVKTLDTTPQDVIDKKAETYTERPMVAYDYEVLQNEIVKINEVLNAQDSENSHLEQ